MAATKKKSFREIARSLNVSPATVSRIAAGIGSFSEETRQTVLAALEAEGYSLQAEKEPQVPAIAAVVTDLSNELYNNILTCLTRYLGRKGYLLRIYLENQSQEELITHLQSEQPAGIILLVLSALECVIRVIGGVHYPEDVIIGYLTGVIMGLFI